MMKTFVANPKVLEKGYTTSESDSMEGSRSRSEEDLRDIGSARRLDDDDTADSAWKEIAEPNVNSTPEVTADEEKSAGAASGSDGDVAEARVLDNGENSGEDAMETDEEEDHGEEDEDEEEEDQGEEDEEEIEHLGAEKSQSEGEPSASEGGSDSDSGTKGGSSKSSSYSRAFSKIIQSKAAKESDTGPVLAARQTLVARKLEEAGDTKDKKDTKKEKKELREKAHLYPQSFTDNKEKDLVKLATRGVVKLFNAVTKAQKVQANADGRDASVVAKQSKAAFLAEVKGPGTSAAVGSKRKSLSSSEPPFKSGTSESQNQSTSRWSAVKDDFMIGKQKLKDWDKDEEMDNAAEAQQMNNGIDDDSD